MVVEPAQCIAPTYCGMVPSDGEDYEEGNRRSCCGVSVSSNRRVARDAGGNDRWVRLIILDLVLTFLRDVSTARTKAKPLGEASNPPVTGCTLHIAPPISFPVTRRRA